MAKLLNLMQSNPLTLLVSLPENTLGFAKAAVEAGADTITLVIDSYEKYLAEKDNLFEIIKKAEVPVGISLNTTEDFEAADYKNMIAAGADYIAVPIIKVPPLLKEQKEIAQVYILNKDYTIDELLNIKEVDKVVLEAKISKHKESGREINVGDLQNYITMATSTHLPIIVPTEKRIHPSEVPIIWDTGVKGIELTSVVLGQSEKSLQKVTREYRMAIDDLVEA
ncbi:MAG: hypothetical protein KKB81_04995 [Candidatus Margulisbacteria bacterium]|nr:hypothetical protein [Candidatus Margulisiibacteriota bacterium]MBU1021385.1 hypothetical protein [Candidatus Margulisiibacteriota bacterium]MBU1729126.1 hypothetical protein [Candidatus Margulisiibacteriota bacterium]MBU1954799.1 hypothetical protein [Candidatus Margulisiibacteriota bacterium]